MPPEQFRVLIGDPSGLVTLAAAERVVELCYCIGRGIMPQERAGYFLNSPPYLGEPALISLDLRHATQIGVRRIPQQKPLVALRSIQQRFGHISLVSQGDVEFVNRILEFAL